MSGYEVYMLLRDRKMLARLMIVQGVSARQLAKAAGWKSHSYMVRLLSGETRWVRIEPAVKIATYLGVAVTDIFTPKASSESGQTVKQHRRAS